MSVKTKSVTNSGLRPPKTEGQETTRSARARRKEPSASTSERVSSFVPSPSTDVDKALSGVGELSEDVRAALARLDAWEGQASKLLSEENFKDTYVILEPAIELGQQLLKDGAIPPSRLAQLCARMVVVCDRMGRQEEAVRHVLQGRAALASSDADFGQARFMLDLVDGLLTSRAGHHELARAQLEDALAKGGGLPSTPILRQTQAHARNWLANALASLNDPRATEEYIAAVELARRAGDPNLAATVLLNLANDYLAHEKPADAERFLDEAFSDLGNGGSLDNRSYALATKARLMLKKQDPAAAKRLLDEAADFANKAGTSWNLSSIFTDRALAHLMLSEHTEALVAAKEAQRVANDDPARAAEALEALGQVELARGERENAKAAFEAAVTLYDQTGDGQLADTVRSRLRAA